MTIAVDMGRKATKTNKQFTVAQCKIIFPFTKPQHIFLALKRADGSFEHPKDIMWLIKLLSKMSLQIRL